MHCSGFILFFIFYFVVLNLLFDNFFCNAHICFVNSFFVRFYENRKVDVLYCSFFVRRTAIIIIKCLMKSIEKKALF